MLGLIIVAVFIVILYYVLTYLISKIKQNRRKKINVQVFDKAKEDERICTGECKKEDNTHIVRLYNEDEIRNLYKNKDSIYVCSNGNDDNDGLSEETSFESLEWAFNIAQKYKVNKITVIGKLDSMVLKDSKSIFSLAINPCFNDEILITGKTDASKSEKAILTSKEKDIGVLFCFLMDEYSKGKIRFENIEIINGDFGLWLKEITVILGKDAVIRNNSIGVVIDVNSTLILDGGIISGNDRAINIGNSGIFSMLKGAINNNGGSEEFDNGGVLIQQGGVFKMYGGMITDNKATGDGGGVYVEGIGTFELYGGVITKNIAYNAGGGVIVLSMGIFKQNGGSIIDNEAKIGKNKNIYIQNGAIAQFADQYYDNYISSIS